MKNREITIFFLIYLLCSCSTFNPFEDEGEYIEKRVDLFGITKIENLNNFEIQLVQDDEEFVLFKGGKNMVEKVKVTLDSNNLLLDHNYGNWSRNFNLIIAEIHLKKFETITLNAALKIVSQDYIEGDHLDINVTLAAEVIDMDIKTKLNSLKFHSKGKPSGGYQFSGVCNSATFIMNGVTNINASKLECQNISIAQNSVGEAHVWAEEKLNVTIYNIGDIYYKGNPEIEVTRVQINNQSPTAKVLPE